MTYQLLQKSSVVTSQLKQDIPDFKVGCEVKVHYKIKEGGKERIQIFQGLVINRHGGNQLNGTFTVVKNAAGQVKVTRTFPVHSPSIAKIELISSLRRARRANIRNLVNLKDPLKVVRTKLLKPRKVAPTPQPKAEPVETKVEEKTESTEENTTKEETKS